ncbi:MAG: hypothetical protein Q7U97_12720 [Rhodocyclaceae bacterium]|nr:hypothetical protein [Rhodocyclaceae bacterium]
MVGSILATALAAGIDEAPFPLLQLLVICLAALSFVDDARGLSFPVRLVCHLAAAAAWTAAVLQLSTPIAFIMVVVAMAWMTNLFNFMDGADGLAGGMALFGFGAYALASTDPLVVANVAVIVGAAAGFLVLNFHPAKVFMGDSGSIPLGFIAAALGVYGWDRGMWPIWFPALVFAPFVLDASVTLAKRLARGERIWLAHRDHYYQRLVRMGWGHRRTALAEYSVMMYCSVAAFYLRTLGESAQWLAGIGAILPLAAAMAWVDTRWKQHVLETA